MAVVWSQTGAARHGGRWENEGLPSNPHTPVVLCTSGGSSIPRRFRRLNFQRCYATCTNQRLSGMEVRERGRVGSGRGEAQRSGGELRGDVVSFECNLLSRIDPDVVDWLPPSPSTTLREKALWCDSSRLRKRGSNLAPRCRDLFFLSSFVSFLEL